MYAHFCMINQSCQVDKSLFGRNPMRRRWLRIYFCSKSSWVPTLYLMLHGVYVWINLSFRVISHEKTMKRRSGHGFHAYQMRVETRELPEQFCCTSTATPTSIVNVYFRVLLGNRPRCWRSAIILKESGMIELPLLTTSPYVPFCLVKLVLLSCMVLVLGKNCNLLWSSIIEEI